jgi:hypothetical protein
MYMARRKVVDREDAEDLLDAWQEGNLEFRDFCADRGVDGRSLRCWRTNLERREAPRPSSAVRLVEVTPRTAPVRSTSTYRVIVGDVTVEIDDAFCGDTLLRLLDVVGRC